MKIATTTSKFGAADSKPLDYLREHGVEVILNPFERKLTVPETLEFLADKDGVVAGLELLDESVLKQLPNLKAIARVGIGMDNVDIDFAKSKNIKVSNTPDEPTKAVAEATLTACLNLLRCTTAQNQDMHEKKWNKVIGESLDACPVLIVGFGRIGQKTASLFAAFGADIKVYDPNIKQCEYPLVELHEGLRFAKVVSLHAGGSAQIIGADEVNVMQEGAYLLNSARGSLVDEQALTKALRDNKLAGAWFDVFWEEPYSGPLTEFPNVILTPHTGTYTRQCRLNMELSAAKNILRDLGIQQ